MQDLLVHMQHDIGQQVICTEMEVDVHLNLEEISLEVEYVI